MWWSWAVSSYARCFPRAACSATTSGLREASTTSEGHRGCETTTPTYSPTSVRMLLAGEGDLQVGSDESVRAEALRLQGGHSPAERTYAFSACKAALWRPVISWLLWELHDR